MTASTRTQRSGEGRNTLVMPAHDGILLATKRVQVQFTYTKSTSRLDTHGLLPEDSDNRRNNRHGPHSQPASQDPPGNSPSREAHGPRQIMDMRNSFRLLCPNIAAHDLIGELTIGKTAIPSRRGRGGQRRGIYESRPTHFTRRGFRYA